MSQTAQKKRKPLSQQAVIRAVASSTAVETGQHIPTLEQKLRRQTQRFSHIKLAR